MRCAAEPEGVPYGVYHFAGAGDASWFEFATTIVEMSAGRRAETPQVVPIRTSEFPTAATRPLDSRLDCTAIVRAFDVDLRSWREALEETIDRLLANKDFP